MRRRSHANIRGKLRRMGRNDIDAIGDQKVSAARDENLAPEIAGLLGLRVRRVRRILVNVHGSTLVRNAFGDVWPEEDDTDQSDKTIDLGDATVAAARNDGLAPEISRVTGLRTSDVRRELERTHGRALVRNVFEEAWPTAAGDTEVTDSDDGTCQRV